MAGTDDELTEIADAFDRDTDPLAQYEPQFEGVDVDPLEMYLNKVQVPNGASRSTRRNYYHSYNQWKEFMESVDRHFACPNVTHVKQFIQHLVETRDNCGSTIRKKVNNINRAYEWWQEHHVFPHPADYNPFRLALRQTDLSETEEQLKHPPLKVADLTTVVNDCRAIRKRLFLLGPLKLGVRAGELLNIKLQDIAISRSELDELYPELGTADPVKDYDDAIYIPSRLERDGNKSWRPRVLPLDDELKQVLIQYLSTRPMVDSPWLILSQRTHDKITRGDRVNGIWKEYFATYNKDDQYRDITSHYGRYFFTNYWKVHEDIPRELVQYMRGDKLGDYSGEAINEYLTAYYDDIQELYLNRIFKLLL